MPFLRSHSHALSRGGRPKRSRKPSVVLTLESTSSLASVPARTPGGSRRYSLRHVEQLREIARLSGEGMSLPGIARILELENRVRELHTRVRDLEARVEAELANRPGARVFAAGPGGSVITLRHGRRVRRATEIVLWRPRHALPPASDTPAGDD
ncbi:MAG TPA: MerR family transcriptional regulator [Microbacterium sp.]|nr:MerR family transcriptional regulator [Microbacterium sp.]